MPEEDSDALGRERREEICAQLQIFEEDAGGPVCRGEYEIIECGASRRSEQRVLITCGCQ